MSFKTTATRLYNSSLKILIEHVYITLFVGTIISLTVAYCTYSPSQEFMAGILALPGISALCAATFQLLKDHAAHQRKKEELQIGHNFTLGISSYMSQKVFDKHIDFCEEYITELDNIVDLLIEKGPHETFMTEARKLYNLRRKYHLWLSSNVEDKLHGFEIALNNVGNNTNLAKQLDNNDPRRSTALDEAQKEFMDIMQEVFNNHDNPKEGVSVNSVKDRIKSILEIDSIIRIRQQIIAQAISNIDKNSTDNLK